MPHRFTRLPPAGGGVGWREAWAALRATDPARELEDGLRELLGAQAVTLHASGREALRVALAHLAARSGRSEVVLPAYTCYSVPASAVAAGLRVRLVDVTPEGQVDADALAKFPLERAAALVVCNLLGVAEPIARLQGLLRSNEVALVDDVAQALGARTPEGPVGGRGDVGLLSFGRGKPLSALGGGALAWAKRPAGLEPPRPARPRRAAALGRAAAYRLALLPWVFRWLAAIPALEIGETIYDPGFPRGEIHGASLCLAAARLPLLADESFSRRARAEDLALRMRERTRFRPLCSACEGSPYPRLGALAPSAEARDAALAALAWHGATRMYPSTLDRIEPLRPHLVGSPECPGAREFAERLMTLPTHAGLRPHDAERIVATLEGVA